MAPTRIQTGMKTQSTEIGRQDEGTRAIRRYSPVREAERDGMDNPERFLHHVAEVEPRNKLLLPGGPSPGVRREYATEFAFTRRLLVAIFLGQRGQVEGRPGLAERRAYTLLGYVHFQKRVT
jgi:hypothetical protein